MDWREGDRVRMRRDTKTRRYKKGKKEGKRERQKEWGKRQTKESEPWKVKDRQVGKRRTYCAAS